MIPYLLALLVTYSGLAIGLYITEKTPSEQRGLKRYAPLMQRVFYLLALGLFLSNFSLINLTIVVVALLGLWKPLIGYPLLGVLFFYSYPDLRVSIAIFLYGLASGTAYFLAHEQSRIKKAMNALFVHSGYIVAALITYVLAL